MALLVFVLAAITAGRAAAHAEFVGAEPADGSVLERAPTLVRVYFSEPLESEFHAVEVYASDRSRLDVGGSRISATDARVLEVDLREAPAGIYTVAWRALSLDSHVIRGVFAYTVGAGASPGRPLELALPAAGAPFAVEAATRWVTFLGFFILFGGFAFVPLVLQPAVASVGRRESLDVIRRWWVPVGWVALATLLVATFASLIFQASSAAGVPLGDVLGGRAVTRLLTATKFGAVWMVRLAFLLGLAGVLTGIAVGGASRRAWPAGAVLTAGALLTVSLTGHASAVRQGTALAVGIDWLHLLAGGLWVGGLVQLALTLVGPLRTLSADDRRRLLGSLVPRFSWMAGGSVGVLVLTGLLASRQFVPSWNALMDTVYGAWLSGKLLLFVPLVLLATVNLLVMHPHFRRRSGATPPPGMNTADGRIRTFRRLVVGEVVLVLGVLAATGALIGVPPASSLVLEARPFFDSRTIAGNNSLTVSVSPNQAGDNLVDVVVEGPGRATFDRARLILTTLEMDMAPRELEALPVAGEPGRFTLRGNALSMPGRWEVAVQLRQAGVGEETYAFPVRVGEAPGANRPAFSPGRIAYLAIVNPNRESVIPVNTRTVIGLGAVGTAWFILTRNVPAKRRRADRRNLIGLSAAIALAGVGLSGSSVAEAYWLSLPNPVPATAASLARGQERYESAGCASCHGFTGRGDGPEGRLLRPRPADFRVHMAAGHTDRQLFDWISEGVAGTAMPPFKGVLSEEDRWHVVNYIRAFAIPQGGQ